MQYVRCKGWAISQLTLEIVSVVVLVISLHCMHINVSTDLMTHNVHYACIYLQYYKRT